MRPRFPKHYFAANISLSEYLNYLTLLKCDPLEPHQTILLRPLTSSPRTFTLLLANGRCSLLHLLLLDSLLSRCLEPREVKLLKDDLASTRTILGSETCTGAWRWSDEGQLVWQGLIPWLQGEQEERQELDSPQSR